MSENMLCILKIEPGQAPQVKEIQNDLASLQAEVGGWIECISFPNGCVAVCNEEGKLNGMPPNRRLGADIICGPFFVCDTTREGNFASLSKSKVAEYSQLFKEIPEFTGQEPELQPGITFIGFEY
ncbi:DUF3846 domain protein [Desulfitobacterium hafniense]|uniref:DUF3846 domain protein n=2 Tax=Desulfitobacterium hafniense TaxID=49338 RepID=A0A098AVA4_DESHA|nr:DUF3846 domain-containing protein [Desulfitobacterium hafniense]CDW99997.1 DUF3846 domain protein [Desulfitobacterium hafniense]